MDRTQIDAQISAHKIDYSRKWFVMVAIGLSTFLETIDVSIVNVALPTLVRVFDTDFATIQWIILAFVLTQATLMLGVGRLGDMIGKKRVFVIGFVVTGIGTVLCALAPSIGWLIGFRVIQASGTAMALALIMGIATEAFPPTERGKALGTVAAIVSVGIIVGPLVGGYLLEVLSWRWIFLVNVPIVLVGIPVALRYLPDVQPMGKQRFDYLGGGIFFLCLLAFLLAMTYGQRDGYGTPRILLLLAAAVVAFALFVTVEKRVAQPVIDLQLFQDALFNSNLTLRFISFVVYVGVSLLLPFYLENMLRFSPRQVGMLLAVLPLAFGLSAPIAGILSDRFGPHPIVVSGLLLMLLGAGALSTLSGDTTIWGYALRLIPFGAGMGIFQSPNNSIIMGAVPPTRLGMTSSLISVIRSVARSSGVAIVGAFWISRMVFYSGQTATTNMSDVPLTAQIPALQETFLAIGGIVLLALILSIWGWRQERR